MKSIKHILIGVISFILKLISIGIISAIIVLLIAAIAAESSDMAVIALWLFLLIFITLFVITTFYNKIPIIRLIVKLCKLLEQIIDEKLKK